MAVFALPIIPFVGQKAAGWQPPQEWASYAAGVFSLQGTATSAGTLFGLLAGVAWFARQGGFQTKGPWWQLILRYLLGVAGVLIIRYGLKYLLPDGDSAVALFCRYLRYALIGLWVTAGATWVFVRIKLAEKAN